MRIVSWNCCGKFREKFAKLTDLDADIYVIQECENPETATHQNYKKFAENAFWQGYKSKGLGVFSRSSLSIKRLNWENHLLRHFMPVVINGYFTLLATWACDPHIAEYAVYQDIHYDKFNNEMVIIGDLNSNKIWDTDQRISSGRSHSNVVSLLAQKGLCSAYHHINGENQGEETRPTFCMHRNKSKPYHIDYCFINPNRIKAFSIPDSEYWLQYSDHIPIILDMSE